MVVTMPHVFSSLTQINKDNVASLQEIARFKIPETMSFQSEPVVIGDVMYVATLVNTYAIDARSCRAAERALSPRQLG